MTIDEACERLNMAEDLLGDALGYLDGNEWGISKQGLIDQMKAYFDFKESGRAALAAEWGSLMLLTPDEMNELADDIEASDGLLTLGPAPIQLGIRRTAAIIAMLRDRRKYSLLESQFANCHKEIARLRAELLNHADMATRS